MSQPPRRSDNFAALVARHPENELFHFSLAQALVAEHRLREAVEHFKFCTAKKADWMMPRILLGKLYLELGQKPEARIQFQDALKLAVEQSHEEPERELRALLAEL
ncbi:MAG TPA: molecular chaperone DnaJ [Opitutaceae bacterium]|nr:molecular chaperone DnaJ [Opitutaceae bacterium]